MLICYFIAWFVCVCVVFFFKYNSGIYYTCRMIFVLVVIVKRNFFILSINLDVFNL